MKTIPTHTRLRSFALMHTTMLCQDQVDQLCTWICHIVASCPLESLDVSCKYPRMEIRFNNLNFPLPQQHAGTLRFLRLHWPFVEPQSMRVLCERFVNLEELSVMMNWSALVRI
jgi:hypothetical protein